MTKRRSTGPDRQTRSLVWSRAMGRCEICGKDVNADMASIHHRKPRRMGGTVDSMINDPSNLMLICGSGTTGCHGNVEANRQQAYKDGHILYSGDDPLAVPVRIRGLGFKLLTSQGSYL